jgi:hypothetical protein
MAETIFTSERNIFMSHTLCFLTVYVKQWLFYYIWESIVRPCVQFLGSE